MDDHDKTVGCADFCQGFCAIDNESCLMLRENDECPKKISPDVRVYMFIHPAFA